MSFDERLGWLLLGCAIGFVMGYIVASLRDISQKVDHVESALSQNKNEDGKINWVILNRIALGLVVALTAFAAFQSQQATNKSNDVVNDQAQNSLCTQAYLGKTIDALNERTTYTVAQATANVNLQKSQLAYVNIFLAKPPPTRHESVVAFKTYITALSHFVVISGKSKETIKKNPFPTTDEFSKCLKSKE